MFGYRIYEMRAQKAARLLDVRCNASLLGRVCTLEHPRMRSLHRVDEPMRIMQNPRGQAVHGYVTAGHRPA
jgi:hypothetical protein